MYGYTYGYTYTYACTFVYVCMCVCIYTHVHKNITMSRCMALHSNYLSSSWSEELKDHEDERSDGIEA